MCILRLSLFYFDKIWMIDFTIIPYITQSNTNHFITDFFFFFNIVTLKVLLFDRGIWWRMRAYFHLCTKMKWCMLYCLRFDTANHWIPSELTLCYWIFMCFLSHNGTKSNHYFILSFCGKSRLCYGDNNDNGFLLYLHHAYDLANGCVLPKCVYISRMCNSKQCSLETKIQGMCDTFF